MKREYKILLCYLFASICLSLVTGGFEGHPHVAYSNSWVVGLVAAPFAPFSAIPNAFMAIFDLSSNRFGINGVVYLVFTLAGFFIPFLASIWFTFRGLPAIKAFLSKRGGRETSIAEENTEEQ